MGNVTLNFSEEEYRIFQKYCTNYCHLYDEARKNSIRIFLELFQRRVIDIREHSLENVFLFFYEKKQEAEAECQIPGIGPAALMRLRLCTDIIAFLEDLEKIYVLLRKKGIDANYILILGAFFKMFDDERRKRYEDLYQMSSGEINAIVLPLHNAIGRKIGMDADTPAILCALGGFVTAFNSLSPDFLISEELVTIIGISLLKTFGKDVPDEEIPAFVRACREKAEADDFECALEGKPRAHDPGDLDCSWEDMKKLLRILNERIVQAHGQGRFSPEVVSALAAPAKILPGPAEYSGLSLSQYQGGVPRRRHDENRFLIHVDSRPASEVSVSPFLSYTSADPGQDDPYKQYYTVTFGALALVIMILAIIALPIVMSGSGFLLNMTNSNGKSVVSEKAGTVSVLKNPSVAAPGVAALNMAATPKITPVKTRPTPAPAPAYVTVEPIPMPTAITNTPASHRQLFTATDNGDNLLYDMNDYISIYENDWDFTQANAYRVSYNLKNPPMLIHYSVIPYNITDVKWFTPRDAAKLIDTAIIVRPFEGAWFNITANEGGEYYDEARWGKDSGTPFDEQVFVLRKAGNYSIDFSGNFVNAKTEIYVKKEGNIQN